MNYASIGQRFDLHYMNINFYIFCIYCPIILVGGMGGKSLKTPLKLYNTRIRLFQEHSNGFFEFLIFLGKNMAFFKKVWFFKIKHRKKPYFL